MKHVRYVESKEELRSSYRDLVGKIEGKREFEIGDRSVGKPAE
jgi:hypothetical protein